MKKYFSVLAAFAFVLAFSVSCTEDCKNCHSRTTNNADGAVVQTGTDAEYCDTDLEAKENEEPYNDGSTTTTWVCE